MTEYRIDTTALDEPGTADRGPTLGVRVPPPCDAPCPNRDHCQATGESCDQMDGWITTGEANPTARRDPRPAGQEPPNLPARSRVPADPDERRVAFLAALTRWPPMGQATAAAYLGRSRRTLVAYRDASRMVPTIDLLRAWTLAEAFEAGEQPAPYGRNTGRARVPTRGGGCTGHSGPHRPEGGAA